jgi:hypothetical protein
MFRAIGVMKALALQIIVLVSIYKTFVVGRYNMQLLQIEEPLSSGQLETGYRL